MKDYEHFIYKSRYARWSDLEGRREEIEETVGRYLTFFEQHISEDYPIALEDFHAVRKDLEQAMLDMAVLPSMRAFMTAGKALERDHVAGYNCAYLPIDRPRSFDEAMYILLCGTGVGYSVEKHYVEKLPEIAETFHETDTTIVVADSKIGWASSFRELLSLLYSGKVPRWDLSRIRPAGARLRTFGGRASGPGPLQSLFEFAVQTFRRAAGRRLTTLEAHDLVCKIADVVVVGGVRRSALISLSDLSDERMREAKSGNWWEASPWRALANNSAVYTEKPELGVFIDEWKSLYTSKSGERGIFNRQAGARATERSGRRNTEGYEMGTNPCSEIVLRPRQFCNLTEVVIRSGDSLQDLKRKVELATILGTLQSTLTDFRYLSKEWKTNCEEERLLGVSLTGICDHDLLSVPSAEMRGWLTKLKEHAIETNTKWAKILGISSSAAITCVKPSGTVSQLVDSSSGIHPRYAPYYIRTVRCDKKDPIGRMLRDQGVPFEDDVTKPESTGVFSFPRKSPKHSRCTGDYSALEQLELWKEYQEFWCEHKPSCTVFVGEDEWLDVGAWVWRHFDQVSGLSFLPRDSGTYRQAPYRGITEEAYKEALKAFPKIDWSKLWDYEKEDLTTASSELACVAGSCEI